jgi:subtilisin family serine protease
MAPLDLVRLKSVMQLTQGSPDMTVAIIDGPVDTSHPDFLAAGARQISAKKSASCHSSSSPACAHGTMVAGVLFARRHSAAPAICPNCSLLIRPIFAEHDSPTGESPSATPEELAEAIIETVNAGARVINLSSGVSRPREKEKDSLNRALNFAASRGSIVVVSSGNQSNVGGSCITQHAWVIPVVSCKSDGTTSNLSNLGSSIGRQGLRAPGQDITSLGPGNTFATFSGTSAACPFVTGAIALLWSRFPWFTAAQIKMAILGDGNRNCVVPPLMNVSEAWRRLDAAANRRRAS